MLTFRLFQTVRARWRLILVTLVIIVAAVLLVSLILPKTYKATAAVMVAPRTLDPISGNALPPQTIPNHIATQIDLAKSEAVANMVIDRLRLTEDKAILEVFHRDSDEGADLRNWLVRQLLKKLDISPTRESSVIELSYRAPSAAGAAAVANAFAQEYVRLSAQIRLDPIKRASTYFSAQLNELRKPLEQAQQRLAKYQQQNGIVNLDARFDVATAHLNDLAAELARVQSQLEDANSRQVQTRNNGTESPDAITNLLLQNLKATLAQAEGRFKATEYQQAKAEVDNARANLSAHTRSVSNAVENQAVILRQRETALREHLAAQKNEVLEINRKRDGAQGLISDVESSRELYEAAVKRLGETSLEGQFNQAEVSVLSLATPPDRAATPNLPLNAALGIFFGVLFGLGAAIIADLNGRRVRSCQDMADIVQVPVFGRPVKRWS
jgi:chain length determinant protein EpsF